MVYVDKNKYLEDTINKYGDMVYRIAMTRTGNKENSEDIFQEVFYRLAKKKPKFVSDEHEKAWLIRVTINCSKTLLKTNFKYDLAKDIPFENSQRHDVYYQVLELPLKYRTIIYLYYYEGYKIQEISKILKKKENTVKSQLLRAREQLKLKMKGGFEEDE